MLTGNPHAYRWETTLAAPLHPASFDPTLYDLKVGRTVNNQGFKSNEKLDDLFLLTEEELSNPQVLDKSADKQE